MKIVRPYAIPLWFTEFGMSSLKAIESAARISHRSEDAMTDSSAEKFLRAVVLGHGDWSVVEHVSVTVEFYVDRGITHELVRHRLFSYTQESTRFVNYEKKMPPSFIYPKPEVECQHCLAGNEVHSRMFGGDPYWGHDGNNTCPYDHYWLTSISVAENYYKVLIKNGWRPQEARSLFPNALGSKIWMTGNLRNWRHFFLMRTTKEAHPQMRQVTIPLLEEFKKNIPVLFEDIEPNSRQVDNIAKGR